VEYCVAVQWRCRGGPIGVKNRTKAVQTRKNRIPKGLQPLNLRLRQTGNLANYDRIKTLSLLS